MRYIAFLLYATLMCVFVMLAGCSNENPICTDSFCLIPREGVEGDIIEVDESKVLALIGKDSTIETTPPIAPDVDDSTPPPTAYTFEPVEITGRLSWTLLNDDWEYTENGILYLKKVIVEIETDAQALGANRVLLVNLEPHAIRRDATFKEYVPLFAQKIVKLTGVLGIGEYQGEIKGVPTK